MEPIAIVGMSCRFPGAPNIRAFWDLLTRGGDAITEVPPDRYDISKYYDPKPATRGKVMSRYGGFLDHVDQFDAAFFGISPREAAKMDPQHRLLMEVAWEAMEDAGMVPASMTEQEKLNIACFIGLIQSDYGDLQLQNFADLDVYSSAGSARAAAAGRVSYALNLNGTSFSVDSACSSSLICIDQAVTSLRSGAHTAAIVGGVNIIVHPTLTIAFSQGKMMADHCKAFDASADGYVRSEGAGVVALKLLSKAQADGDRIYATIVGSACSNDGQCDSFMAPSTRGQQAGLRKACQNAGIDPLSINYVEAHGPGTQAGDPVEITTLGEVLCQGRAESAPLLVGSVKTNIGHTEGAAGVAGLIKTVLCLQHKMIPPNLHFHEPNPAIPWQDYALKVPTELTPWPSQIAPRRAGVCSYGISGTNAYVILEEMPPQATRQEEATFPTPLLLPISSRSTQALADLAQRYIEHLEAPEGASLFDICATASLRRTHHDHRLAVVSRSKADAREKLQAYLRGQNNPELVSGQVLGGAGKMVWIFPGQGSQWLGMGRDLLVQEPVFRSAIGECDALIQRYVGWSLIEQLQADEQQSRLNEINVVQPTLFAIEVALAALWRSWGVVPDAVVGHSMGEAAAAYIAGALSLEDAVWIICKRSELLLHTSGKGAMAAVEMTLEQATTLVADYAGRVSVAVSNSANSTVLSGDPKAIEEILTSLERQNIFGRLVKVDVASHSPQMDPLRDDLLRLMQRVQPRRGTIPIYSTVTGNIVDGSEFFAEYWVENLREPVLFHTAIQASLRENHTIFMEMSPHPLLVGAIRQTIEQCEKPALALSSLHRDEPGKTALLASLGRLYVQGLEISWACLYPNRGSHVSLPSYPWQKKRYWNEKLHQGQALSAYQHHGGHPILGTSLSSAIHPETFWTTEISPEIFPFLNEHRVDEIPVLPGSAYTELAVAAATEVFGPQFFQVENLVLSKALFFPKGSTSTLQATLSPGNEAGTILFQLFSRPANENEAETSWLLHAQATIQRLETPQVAQTSQYPLPEQVRSEWTLEFQAAELYQNFRNGGMQHGHLFQSVTEIWRRSNQTMARLVMPGELADDLPGYQIHPALLDAVQHAIAPFFFAQSNDGIFLPTHISKVILYRSPLPGEVLWSYASVQSENTVASSGTVEGDITLTDADGKILLELQGFHLQLLDRSHSQDFLRPRLNRMLYGIQWEQQKSPVVSEETSRKTWLLFDGQQGLGRSLAAQIKARGSECILVFPGHTFRQLEEHHYEVHPGSPESFQSLFTLLSDEDKHIDGIIYLWGLLTRPAMEDDPAYISRTSQEVAGVGMLHLIQAIAAQEGNTSRLWVVTRGVHVIDEQSDTATALLQAPFLGLKKSCSYELPGIHCSLIDLEDNGLVAMQAQTLFQEIWSDNASDEVALRTTGRYVARLIRQELPEQQETKPLFRPDGTYVVTGGLGGVGRRAAQWMVKQGARHLVLFGRRGPSEEAQAVIQDMEAEGAEVRVMQVDVAQEGQLSRAFAQIRRDMPPLRGIFHSAVVLDDGTLQQLDRERFLSVMPPKVDGTWNLHRLTLNDPLDYFVTFSSVASSLGSPGQGNYAAANAFMDQMAYYRRQRGLPALSINWGRWGEVGQATKGNRGERMDARGFMAMKPAEGLAILGSLLHLSLLHQAPTQISAMSFRFAKWSQFFPELMHSEFFAHLSQEEETLADNDNEQQMTREKLLELQDDQRQQALALYIEKQIAQVLGHASLKLENQQQFNRLGIDSLMAVELKNRINNDLDISISAIAFLQGGSFGQLTEQIEAALI